MSNVENLAELDFHAFLEEKDFFHQFQPLFDLSNWNVCGYEALFRCHSMTSPEAIFNSAKAQDKLFELDKSSISKAISLYILSKKTETLFVNLDPETLLHPSFSSYIDSMIAETNFSRNRLVFELTHASDLLNTDASVAALSLLRQHGFRIAFDQVGPETADMLNSIQIYPDYIKLDRYFSTDLSASEAKQKVIDRFLRDSKERGQLILKGIEQPDDLAVAKLLGVTIGQGYLLGIPIEL